jgi:hypothetical protein
MALSGGLQLKEQPRRSQIEPYISLQFPTLFAIETRPSAIYQTYHGGHPQPAAAAASVTDEPVRMASRAAICGVEGSFAGAALTAFAPLVVDSVGMMVLSV